MRAGGTSFASPGQGPPASLTSVVGMKREPTYRNGEPIREGDMVRIGQWDGVVDSINKKGSPGYMDYVGEGVMLTGPTFGRLQTKFDDEDLVLVRRKQQGNNMPTRSLQRTAGGASCLHLLLSGPPPLSFCVRRLRMS